MSQKKKVGFALFTPEKMKAIASQGGKATQSGGRPHRFTSREASVFGVKGGKAVFKKYGSEHMAMIGARGGKRKKEEVVGGAGRATGDRCVKGQVSAVGITGSADQESV